MKSKLQKAFIKSVNGMLVWLTVNVLTTQVNAKKDPPKQGLWPTNWFSGKKDPQKQGLWPTNWFSGKKDPPEQGLWSTSLFSRKKAGKKAPPKNKTAQGLWPTNWFSGKKDPKKQGSGIASLFSGKKAPPENKTAQGLRIAANWAWSQLCDNVISLNKKTAQGSRIADGACSQLHDNVFSLNEDYCTASLPETGKTKDAILDSPQSFVNKMSQKFGCPVYCLEFTNASLSSSKNCFFNKLFIPFQESVEASKFSDRPVIQTMRAIFDGKVPISGSDIMVLRLCGELIDKPRSKVILFIVNYEKHYVGLVFRTDSRNGGFFLNWSGSKSESRDSRSRSR